ncbi:hypoxanthine-guanine phosphoribosyltransferase [Orbilia oligospora]|uniref:Hypoxanthine-guanine phosphoribosyltransferase n=1 Tax=Orbilia oligospora TaxID=2813651 RepID=A0A7C8NXK4_ORBOL|nr:hypoxanthine-guanine phosphoribosyltransferase [Orbilia oligospora]KAF3096989.1 hypoxanthine-guanine phosphoribosyltransferase [Orbilia oligospora]KAF3103712.1 hypoxanthine-guanine phosphoribosyltransferase [Orbilia oligospora]KAF3125138.1 hypoxanthine-guanine phosphoribosyltransferase [Orbilia oligospora]KAF3131468.1 hypoxanthine-guanine phosphoribosyltransferase [Orbilia oligospora]
MVQKVYVTYNDVHKLCKESAQRILDDFKPELIIAIGGGGYIPARILRSFLKQPNGKNISIQAIGLSLYENLGTGEPEETPGTEVVRLQWLDFRYTRSKPSEAINHLIGKNILIVDEVDDTRTTLQYAVQELEKDVQEQSRKLGRSEKTNFSIFVLHNKDKEKRGTLPEEIVNSRYLAARTTKDVWLCYPWEAVDIEEHDRLAAQQGENSL